MKLYIKFLKIHFKSNLQYKASFILSIISQFFIFFTYYFSIISLFTKFSNIKGFTMYEVLLTFGIIQFGLSFCDAFFRGMDQFDDIIIQGNFDRLLLRPRNIILQVFGEYINFVRLTRLLQAIIVIIIAIIKINIEWNILKILTFVFMLISSVFLFLSIFILAASYCFITIKGLEVRNVLTNGLKDMAQYPIGVFKKSFVFVLTFIIPFGFVNYYPLLYLLGKKDNHFYIFSPLINVIYIIPSVLIFYKGIKKYTSVGC